MDHYVRTIDGNLGVHINSGIPNRAFYETAAALGGYAWGARRSDLVRDGHRPPSCAPRPTSRSSPS
jgi:hypothetical protein